MSAISDASSASLARALEAVQRPEIPEYNANDALYRDGGGMTDCFPPFEDVGPEFPIQTLPGEVVEDPTLTLPGDHEPVTVSPGDISLGDGEFFVDDSGNLGWRTVVRGTSGDDTIKVVYNADGSADVTVGDKTTHYSPEDAKNMRVDAGAGNDTVTVEDNRDTGLLGPGAPEGGSLTVEGGSGDDTIDVQDRSSTYGDGNTINVDSGSGDDKINLEDMFRGGILPSGQGAQINVKSSTGDDVITGNHDHHNRGRESPGRRRTAGPATIRSPARAGAATDRERTRRSRNRGKTVVAGEWLHGACPLPPPHPMAPVPYLLIRRSSPGPSRSGPNSACQHLAIRGSALHPGIRALKRHTAGHGPPWPPGR